MNKTFNHKLVKIQFGIPEITVLDAKIQFLQPTTTNFCSVTKKTTGKRKLGPK